MARIRTIKHGVGLIRPSDVVGISPDELRRGEGLVYRLLTASGECIYIGYTASPLNRWRSHLSGKAWAGEIAAIYYEAGMPEHRAKSIEASDIRLERPKYNRTVKP